VAGSVEMLSGRRKKDYAAESAAEALAAQADKLGIEPHEFEDEDDDEPATEPELIFDDAEAVTVAA